jgi:hypothetical protein
MYFDLQAVESDIPHVCYLYLFYDMTTAIGYYITGIMILLTMDDL